MRDLFQGYYQPSDKEYEDLWTKGTFVFDTNVLLGVYHFPQESRDAFLSILDKLGQRVWIPYHVGLEFQRNRIRRIKDAGKELDNVEKAIAAARALPNTVGQLELGKRGLGAVDLKQPLEALSESLLKLQVAAEAARKVLPNVSLRDAIRDKLSSIFDGRVGAPPSDQNDMESLIADARDRFDNQIPPGYKDVTKEAPKFLDRGIYYERRHGDLIIWKQLLQHVAKAKLQHVVFVTGDQKDDWWTNDSGETIGPRPELVQEALQLMPKNGCFWMYSTEQFVSVAQKYLKTPVTQEAIDQVREVSATYVSNLGTSVVDDPWLRQNARLMQWRRGRAEQRERALQAIELWVRRSYPSAKVARATPSLADLLIRIGDARWAITTRYSAQVFRMDYWAGIVSRVVHFMHRKKLTHYTIVFKEPSKSDRDTNDLLTHLAGLTAGKGISVILGRVADSGLFDAYALAGDALPDPVAQSN